MGCLPLKYAVFSIEAGLNVCGGTEGSLKLQMKW